MNARNTCFWLAVAAVLLIAILTRHRFSPPAAAGPVKVLPPEFKPGLVTRISVQLKGQQPIRAERTAGVWRLTEPASDAAQSASIESLLLALERLSPAATITAHERRSLAKSDEAEGLTSPQASLSIQQEDGAVFQLEIGARTAPGDQLYLQRAGVAGVYVVDAELLKEIPGSQNDWRDTTFVKLKGLAFDHIAVTNRLNNLNDTKVIELQHEPANHLWRIVNPPIKARADTRRLSGLLEQLEALRVKEFVSDEPKADFETFGLQTPQLELGLAHGTNRLALFQFGKSPTNDAAVFYARRWGRSSVVTVPTNALAGWREQVNAFRATNIIDLPESITAVEVYGQDRFSVQQQGADHWRVVPQNLPADAAACKDLLSELGHLRILEPVDAVTEPEFASDGLAAPARKYIFKTPAPASAPTNSAVAEVNIGATNDNRVFVCVAYPGERFVYAVNLAEVQRLPVASFQMRERQIWNYSDDDIARVTVRQQGKVRQFVHTDKGRQFWALAPGSDGTIEPLAVGETVHSLAQLTVSNWVAHGLQSRVRYGFSDNGGQVTLELKNGSKPTLDLGGPTPAKSLYGAVTLEGEPWIFEFGLAVWIQAYLLSPP